MPGIEANAEIRERIVLQEPILGRLAGKQKIWLNLVGSGAELRGQRHVATIDIARSIISMPLAEVHSSAAVMAHLVKQPTRCAQCKSLLEFACGDVAIRRIKHIHDGATTVINACQLRRRGVEHLGQGRDQLRASPARSRDPDRCPATDRRRPGRRDSSPRVESP